MFGNIKPYKNEMKIRDYNKYRAYYCGVCKSMGGRFKGLCNMGLSYEAVFIGILLSGLNGGEVKAENTKCIMHPLTKFPTVVDNTDVDAAAALNVILMYHSMKDNIKDEKDFKSMVGKIWFGSAYKKAAKAYSELESIIVDELEDLELAQESRCDVPDMAAQPFARMMGKIASRLIKSDGEDKYWLGFFLGKWLYILDAYDDIERDYKSKAYNPFIMMYKNKNAEEVKKLAKDDADYILNSSLSELVRIYDKFEIKQNKEILDNILLMGLPMRTDDVLSGKSTKKKKGD